MSRRVVFWAESFWPSIGGVEILGDQLMSVLKGRGYEFIVVTNQWHEDWPEEEEVGGVPVHRFPFRSAISERRVDLLASIKIRLDALFRDFAPDLVHVNLAGPSVIFLAMSEPARMTPSVVTIHNLLAETGPGDGALTKRVLGAAARVVAPSETLRAHVESLYPELGSRLVVIRNALGAPALEPGELRFEQPRVVCLARLVPEKGVDLAVKAFPAVLDRFPAARLVVAGEGGERGPLDELVGRLGLEGSVEFLGPVEPGHVPALLDSATVVVVPSRWVEPFGLVALEAALMARPVVATRTGGLAEIVVDGETGFLVDREAPNSIAEGVIALLESPVKAQHMATRARQRALDEFGWEQFVDAYDALFHDAMR